MVSRGHAVKSPWEDVVACDIDVAKLKRPTSTNSLRAFAAFCQQESYRLKDDFSLRLAKRKKRICNMLPGTFLIRGKSAPVPVRARRLANGLALS